MTVKPLFDKVVVETLETEEKTKSGFILPSASQEKQQMAKIVAVGPGGVIDGKEIVMQVKVGDTVLYSKYAGSDFKVDGKITFEVGGKDKSFEQIANLPNSYILADAMEHPIGKKLPLWIVGLLY